MKNKLMALLLLTASLYATTSQADILISNYTDKKMEVDFALGLVCGLEVIEPHEMNHVYQPPGICKSINWIHIMPLSEAYFWQEWHNLADDARIRIVQKPDGTFFAQYVKND